MDHLSSLHLRSACVACLSHATSYSPTLVSLYLSIPGRPESHRRRYTPLFLGSLYMSALTSRAVLLFTPLANSFSLYIYIFVDPFFWNFLISFVTLDG